MKNETPDAAEFGRLRAFLAQQGVKQAEIRDAVGTGANGRTRAQISQEIQAWLYTRPKA